MSYAPLYQYLPDVAENETRTITVPDSKGFNLPMARYTFIEMFCDEEECDCRRAFFTVVSSKLNEPVAVIAWGWENREFYVEWMGDDNSPFIDELQGPALNSASRQSKLAPAILELFKNVLLQDKAYVDRVKRHYAMFREKIDGPAKKPAAKKSRRKK